MEISRDTKKLKQFLDGLEKKEKSNDILEMIRDRQEDNNERLKEEINKPLVRNEAAKAYMAAFIDADGSVSLRKSGKDDFRSPCVELFNSDIAIIEKLHKTFGGKISCRKAKKAHWQDGYELRFNTTESLKILQECFPYMIHTKKRQ